MRIIIDVMSGDNAPLELVKGAVLAYEEFGVGITVVGNKKEIEEVAKQEQLDISGLEIIDTDIVIDMEDGALSVVREKRDSSMGKGLHMLAAGDGDAFVSAGNTGALIAGSTLIVRRIKGIHRAAIGTVLPFPTPVLLIDSGANIEVDEKTLEQFGAMGSAYMEKIYGLTSPRVGLINNGTEHTKGTPLLVSAYKLLSESEDINFVGNIEGKEIPFGVCDVLVTDGFTGNVTLKLIEGMGKFFSSKLKEMFYENLITKFSAAIIKNKLTEFKGQFDASEHGGAPLLGISRPVIKAHGSSDALAIKNAVRQAIYYINTGIIYEIAAHAAKAGETAKPEEKPQSKGK